MAICARCFGMLISIPIGVVLGLTGIFTSRWVVIPLFIPMLIDAETQRYGKRFSNNTMRLFTGILFGIGIGIYFCLWLVNDIGILLNY